MFEWNLVTYSNSITAGLKSTSALVESKPITSSATLSNAASFIVNSLIHCEFRLCGSGLKEMRFHLFVFETVLLPLKTIRHTYNTETLY